ncbi:P-loop NTPase fold protein [Pasteurella multocida]|uniref:P-loop NTPase fold protein n=5 Tax=Pasteurella multocida TaxID=747 RepID=UPI0002569FA2|nr:P-loop NTPase fold protein [Pasteurella multocida]AFF24435.1 hypothetical protein PMCN06_1193 [Pasteurella multocida subsp. multocida str. HN06]MCL8064427.1 KAP family NTPase [Pasteurella multocida]MCL8066678.1 KAP family NTPase [Pasteurella multocida]MCW4598164.1 KAP family NTPase [Pasteurella multocida subsp. multocida]MDY0624690.1 KAP family NTPase [Pasteurella multocida]
MNEHIEEYLDIYLTKENIEYATVLTGEWGCGKTYFIRNYIKKKENKKEYKFIYVSLFGLKSISSINQIIFQELHPILSRKEIKALGGALLSAIKFGVKIDLTGGDEKETSVNIDLSKLTIFNNSSYSDLIFIFDDLERTMIDFIEILGFINSLCEKNNSKVIIITNEDEIKNDNKKIYKNFKEKLVGKSFRISNDTKIYWDHISDKYSEHLKENIEKIKSIFNEYGDKNYRNMNQTIENYIDFSKKVKKEFLENADFKGLLIEQFFTISLKYRKKFDIEETFKSLKDEKATIFYNLIFDQRTWSTIVSDFYKDNEELNEIIKLHYIFNEPEISSWQKLWHYRDLNRNDFYENLNDVKSKFLKMEYSSFEIIMHAVSMLIFFIKKEVEKDISILNIKEKNQ